MVMTIKTLEIEHCGTKGNSEKNKPKFKGSRQKIVILTTISSYLFIVSLLVACNHNIDLLILSGMPNHCH